MTERNRENEDINEFLDKKAREFEDTPECPQTKVRDKSQEGIPPGPGLRMPGIVAARRKSRPPRQDAQGLNVLVSRLRNGNVNLGRRRRAAEELAAKGLQVVGIVVPLLSDHDRDTALMAAYVLRRLKWEPENAEIARVFNNALHGWRKPATQPQRSSLRGAEAQRIRQEDGLFGFVDQGGRNVTPCRFESVGNFSEGLAAVKLQGMWGFINQDGEMVIPARYLSADDFDHGVAVVVDPERRQLLIDTSGSVLHRDHTGRVNPHRANVSKQVLEEFRKASSLSTYKDNIKRRRRRS